MLELSSDIDPGLDDLFATWCDHHHSEVIALPGVLRARRYLRADGRPGSGRYLTAYDLVSVAVLDTPAFVDHGRTGTPMPDALGSSLVYQRTVATLIGRAGDISGAETVIRGTLLGGPDRAASLADRLVAPLSGKGQAIGARVFQVQGGAEDRLLVLLDCTGDTGDLGPVMAGDPWQQPVLYRRVFDRTAPDRQQPGIVVDSG
ncbi:MAG TPA: hypothetical protein VHU85_04090 [Acidimicrobiales bacterium]|jgi:hypothetical protein|nr:hypothetical protein [Acidimicrobiales bacterium]